VKKSEGDQFSIKFQGRIQTVGDIGEISNNELQETQSNTKLRSKNTKKISSIKWSGKLTKL
jgi:hypothetical protein